MKTKIKNAFPELTADKLRWECDPARIPFASTDELTPCDEIIGQERALRALKTGLDIKSLGYNIFITGMVGTGRTTTIKQLLERLEKSGRVPDDILYVNNFKNPDEPRLVMLPAGKGRMFEGAMRSLIDMLRTNIPGLLKSPHYTESRDQVVEGQQAKQRDMLKTFEEEVAREGFSVIQVQMGMFVKPDLVPVLDDAPAPFPKVEALVKEGKLPPAKLEELRNKYEELSGKLEGVLARLRELEEETRGLLKKLDEDFLTPIIGAAIKDIRDKFRQPAVQDYLSEVEGHLVGNIELFKNQKKEEKDKEAGADPFLEYQVNLLIDNSELKHAPVVMETNPTYINLFGSIESSSPRFGAWQTDFTKIKAGSFLKANGGYLVLNALDALVEPGVWATLKRTLRNQMFEIQNYATLFLIMSKSLKPEPVKCDVKVVMIGDADIYDLLYFMDQDFKKIFKIKAEFDSEVLKSDKTINDYARFIRKICLDDHLLPFDRDGVAAVIEYGTRLAGRQKKISTRFHILADVIREASYWAGRERKKTVSRKQVEKAVLERFERVSLLEDKVQEMIEEGTILIDTEGRVTGQVNGLSVYDMGQFAFGKPTRITAKTAVGRAGVINIEREADLSGRTHNKGVL
ncbi:MAG: ATP-dependent protease, partial [Candidatus Aminicenantes bacterium RBG_13_62_12]